MSLVSPEAAAAFPDPAYAPRPRSVWRRLAARVRSKKFVVADLVHHGEEFTTTYWQKSILGRGGVGRVVLGESVIGWRGGAKFSTQLIGPGVTVRRGEFLQGADLTGAAMADTLITAPRVVGTNWAGADLTRARFICRDLEGVSFDGADLTGATFSLDSLHGRVSLRDVTFRGANLTDTEFGLVFVDEEATLDFTDSNVTADQFDQFIDAGVPGGNIALRRHTLREFAQMTGEDPATVGTMVWLGEIEFRDWGTDRRATGAFDAARHYIPQWVAQAHRPDPAGAR